MARLVAIRRAALHEQLRCVDDAWRGGDAAVVLDATAPDSVAAAAIEMLQPDVLVTDVGTQLLDGPGIADGTALVVTTSGSTGTPSAVVLSHATLAAATTASRARLAAQDGVPWLGVLPLHHVAGLSVVLRSRAAGVEPSGLHARDSVDVIRAAPRSWISLVPTQLGRLLDAGTGDALATHAGVLLGGAAASPHLLGRAAAAGIHVVTSYGSTETCGGCVYDGVPLDGVEVKADDDGVLAIRGPVVAGGLRARGGGLTPLVDADGWYRTKDRGRVAPDGIVTIDGRVDPVVVSGGENVPLPPVEAALRSLGLFADVAVVGLPDDTYGTAVVAVAVPSTGNRVPPTLGEVRAALADLLPPHHRPTRLIVVEELPRTALGKVTPATVLAVVSG